MPTTINPSDQTITLYNVQTGAASNLLNNVAPAASGTVLTSNGVAAQPSFQAIGNAPTANAVLSMVDDFVNVFFDTGGFVPGLLTSNYAWAESDSSTFNSSAATGSSDHPGIISFAASTLVRFLSASANSSRIILGGGALTVNWVFKIGALSVANPRYVLNIGMGDTNTGNDQTNGIYFRYTDNVNTGQWQIVTAKASVLTQTSTATAVTTGWHNAGLVINAAGTSVEFFMDGVSLGTTATNIPVVKIGPTFKQAGVVGTVANETIAIDLFYLNQVLTTSR